MGSIPIFESILGFDRAFSGLPVLIVESFKDVTPALLEKTWANVLLRIDEFDFRPLGAAFWEDLIRSVVVSGRALNLDDTLSRWDTRVDLKGRESSPKPEKTDENDMEALRNAAAAATMTNVVPRWEKMRVVPPPMVPCARSSRLLDAALCRLSLS
jgi:hypothetical protein